MSALHDSYCPRSDADVTVEIRVTGSPSTAHDPGLPYTSSLSRKNRQGCFVRSRTTFNVLRHLRVRGCLRIRGRALDPTSTGIPWRSKGSASSKYKMELFQRLSVLFTIQSIQQSLPTPHSRHSFIDIKFNRTKTLFDSSIAYIFQKCVPH